MLGCPNLDESDWCRLGSAKYGHDGMQLPAKEWLCSDCEFLIFGIDDTLVDHAAGFDEELRRHIIENPEEICIP